MFDKYSDGYCPQCLLENRRLIMKLNDCDFWECPDCHLQAHSRSAGMFAIMRTRGSCTDFKDSQSVDFIMGWILSPATAEAPYRPQGGFSAETDLRRFLAELT